MSDKHDDLDSWALAVLVRHGWSLADLDFLVYEGQVDDIGAGDPEFQPALDHLMTRRYATANP